MLTANGRDKPEHVKKSAEMGIVTCDTTAQEASRQGGLDCSVWWAGPRQRPRTISLHTMTVASAGRLIPGRPRLARSWCGGVGGGGGRTSLTGSLGFLMVGAGWRREVSGSILQKDHSQAADFCV